MFFFITELLISHSGQIYEGTSFIQLNTIAKCLDKEYKKK